MKGTALKLCFLGAPAQKLRVTQTSQGNASAPTLTTAPPLLVGWVQLTLWLRTARPLLARLGIVPRSAPPRPRPPGQVPSTRGKLWLALVGQGGVGLPICLGESVFSILGEIGACEPQVFSLPSPGTLRSACLGPGPFLGNLEASDPCLHGSPAGHLPSSQGSSDWWVGGQPELHCH